MTPGFLKQDQWQAQIQAQIQLKADVYVYADYLTDAQIRRIAAAAVPRYCRDGGCAAGAVRPGCAICVLPEGPQTIPFVAGSNVEG